MNPRMNRRYEIQQPPSSTNYYKRMQQQRRREMARRENPNVIPQRLRSEVNPTLARYQRGTANTADRPSRGNPRRASAPIIQYSKYLDNTTNVFYDDRKDLATIRKYEVYQPLILKIVFCLFLAWFILLFVTPYPGVCPENADCGVYVYCKEGYNLVDKRCVISKETKQRVSYLCESIINNMKYEYGNQDCQGQAATTKPAPHKSIQALYDQYDITNRAAEEQMVRWFRQGKNQEKYGFSFYNNEVRPNVKNFTIFCKFHKVVGIRGFYVFFVIIVVLGIFVLCLLRFLSEKRRAVKIYESLKKQVMQNREITIDIHEIEKEFGRVYNELWNMVDTARVEDKLIGYYEDQKVHWKLI